MIDMVVIFGATGDLTGRTLLPALAGLHASGVLGADFRLVGSGPQDWTTEQFTAHAQRQLADHAPGVPAVDRDALAASLGYRAADVGDPAQVVDVVEVGLREAAGAPIAVYLALPTWLLLDAVRALQACRLPAGSRVAIEKPFGDDLASAVVLNAALADLDDGVDAYRVDHALAMTAAQQLPGAMSGAQRVEVLWEETLALEGRASFYDRAGALRDVLQNHLMQLLCTLAARPGSGDAAARRAAVLRAVRPPNPADTRRARYTAGRLADGREVPDYEAEDGVDASRGTETFAEVTLRLDLPEWADTRFVLRTGKALSRRRRGVLAHRQADVEPEWLDLDAPDLDELGGAEASAYDRIVADLLGGGSAYAVSADEAELAWQVLTPVLRAWAEDAVPLDSYPAGSAGPAQDGRIGEGRAD